MKIKLRTSDNVLVEVNDHRDMELSVLVRTCLVGCDTEEETEMDEEIPLPNVSHEILGYILEFTQHHCVETMKTIPRPLTTTNLEDLVGTWYNNFITRQEFEDIKLLSALVKAANYLDIHPLQELGCARMACLIRGNEVGEIRRILQL